MVLGYTSHLGTWILPCYILVLRPNKEQDSLTWPFRALVWISNCFKQGTTCVLSGMTEVKEPSHLPVVWTPNQFDSLDTV